MLPTSIRPGRNGWPRGQRSGGRTIHCPDVDRTNSPDGGHSANSRPPRALTCDEPAGRDPTCHVHW
jgi:hypothetical protein